MGKGSISLGSLPKSYLTQSREEQGLELSLAFVVLKLQNIQSLEIVHTR